MPESDGKLIMATLQTVAERHGDPTGVVYRRLFKARPELEALFVMDRDGGVRASMMQQALECILDHADGQRTGLAIIAAARGHHLGYGVPSETFDSFFPIIRDTFSDIMGVDWTAEADRAWATMLAAFAAAR